MKSKGGARSQAAPAPVANPPPPTSPPGGKGAKYRNRDGSKFITLPDSTSAPSSPQPSPTIPGAAIAKPTTNGPAVASSDTSAPAVNRKKQKRREKAAARAAAAAAVNGASNHSPSPAGHDPVQDADQADDSEEGEAFDGQLVQRPLTQANGHAPENHGKSKKSKKKKKKGGATALDDLNQVPAPAAQPAQGSGISRERIWNTSSQEERERIKEFWLGLGEDERKSLVKVEKDAVLKKMKEQQKHTCGCSVCGRKRTAIEEELEGLYDAYYEELEQFANHPQQDGHPPMMGSSRHFGFPHSSRFPSYTGHQPSRGRIVEHVGDEDEEEEEMDEPYSDDELDEDEAYSDEEPEQEIPRDYASDFFNFGSSLTVQGGILTVADDLLKNDGKKFIEMMEQLAERRMARENDSTPDPYARPYDHAINGGFPGHTHPQSAPMDDEEYDEEEEDDDYESQEDDEFDEDDDDTMTEEQRMEEGRRMFQIFAARMFEQRVLQAYREKVAKERQAKLVEEEEEEARKKEAQKEKKAKEAQRKKEKAAQKKAAAAEEKARKDAEKAAEEEARRQAEAEKAEEARRKAEEKRKKKEAQKKAEDDERARKEAEKQRQRQLQLDQERKAREAKEREKKAREEKLQQEKEEREQKEREAKELKEKQEAEKQEAEKQEAEKRQKESKPTKSEARSSQKQKQQEERAARKAAALAATPATMTLPKRPAQPTTNPALPVLPQQPPATNFSSPKPSVATPALPKASAPLRPRQASQQDATSSVPTTSVSETTSLSQSPVGTTPTPSSPGLSAPTSHRGSIASHHSANVSQTMSPLQQSMPRLPTTTQPSQINMSAGMNFPPGLHHAVPPGFANPMFPPVPQYRPPPGMVPPGLSSPMLSRGFPAPVPPPGFPQSVVPDPIGPGTRGSHDAAPSSHSRQPSGGFDSPMLHAAQPIGRPTPIGRPASVVHGQRPPMGIPSAGMSKGGDDMDNHLGSSALLDDSDDVVPTLPEFGSVPRRGYVAPGRPQGFPSLPFGDPGMLQQSQSLWGTSPIQPSVMNSFVQPPAPPPGFGGPTGWPIGSPVPGFSAPIGRPMPSRQPVSIVRQKLCNICRELAMQDPSSDGLIPLQVIQDTMKDQVEFNPLGNGPLTENDILVLCETEGTMVNGGGNFDIHEDVNGRSIRWNEHKAPQPLGAFGAPGQFGSPNSSFGR